MAEPIEIIEQERMYIKRLLKKNNIDNTYFLHGIIYINKDGTIEIPTYEEKPAS